MKRYLSIVGIPTETVRTTVSLIKDCICSVISKLGLNKYIIRTNVTVIELRT
jgi:hypothetical protein